MSETEEKEGAISITPAPDRSCKKCYGTGVYGKHTVGEHAGKEIRCDCIQKSVMKQMVAHRKRAMDTARERMKDPEFAKSVLEKIKESDPPKEPEL